MIKFFDTDIFLTLLPSELISNYAYVVQDHDAPTLWCCTRAVYADACYTRCCNRTSVHMRLLAVKPLQWRRTFIALSASLWNDLGSYSNDLIRSCGIGGFREQGQCLFIGLAARSVLSPTVFPFSSFIIWVGIVGLIWC